ncbi:MAG: chromosomal replication initiator protein DnaA [Candidatus Babeliales bacterium]
MQLIWEEFLKIIKEEAGTQVLETWFKILVLKEFSAQDKTVFLQAPNQFVCDWIQKHYINLTKTHLKRLLNGQENNIIITCDKNEKIETKTCFFKENQIARDIIPASSLKQNVAFKENNFNKNNSIVLKKNSYISNNRVFRKKEIQNFNDSYTFDSFIVGPNNSLAHAASWAICRNLGNVYNPLLIYGGTGLGKTHLMHAIVNEVRKNNPNYAVSYQTTDRFTTEFINSIRYDKTNIFKEKYTKLDLLLLDDVQFLSNKEQTQEIFFHIFNLLHEQKKQIILSSDTFPNEITGLQNRLKSRLEWGLIADIQTPDLETKIAILQKKAELHSIYLSQDVANFIAQKITSNIRELEGALIRVGAFATLTNKKITLEMAQKILLNIDEGKKEGVMLDKILKIVSKNYKISINDLKSKKRNQDIANIRQITFYMMKKLSFCSLQSIGEFVGNRDHSTVLHSVSKVEGNLKQDPSLEQKLKDLEQRILTS